MSKTMIHGWRILFLFWSECYPSQFNHKQMHACMHVCACVIHSFIVIFAGICLLIKYWMSDVFAGVMNMCLGLHFVLEIKWIKVIQSQLTRICASDWQHEICSDLWLSSWAFFLHINLKPDIVDGQIIQNNHLFFNIGQAIDQLFFSSSNCF